MKRFQVKGRVHAAPQVIHGIQMCKAGTVITHEIGTFGVVPVDRFYLVYQVGPLRGCTQRAVHLDVIDLPVIDQAVKQTGLDNLEKFNLLFIVPENVGRDNSFNFRNASPRTREASRNFFMIFKSADSIFLYFSSISFSNLQTKDFIFHRLLNNN